MQICPAIFRASSTICLVGRFECVTSALAAANGGLRGSLSFGEGDFRRNLHAAEGFDDLFGVANLPDAQAEVLAHFHGFAQCDNNVVDQQFQRLLAAL